MSRVKLQSYQFYILLALAGRQLLGAEVRQQVLADTLGLYVRDSTLYDALSILVQVGLVERDGRAYGLTEEGRRRLEVECRTMGRAVGLSQQRLRWR